MPGQTQLDWEGATYGRCSPNQGWLAWRECLACFFTCACRVVAWASPDAKTGTATTAVAQQRVNIESRIVNRLMGFLLPAHLMKPAACRDIHGSNEI
jgi:hypothetical protein